MPIVSFRHHGRTIRGRLTFPSGRPRVPAVVFVHGRASDRSVWSAFLPRFTAAGYAVLTIDLNGHGRSDGRYEDVTFSRAADDVSAAVARLARQRRIFPDAIGGIGASLGATALLMARAAGTPLRSLVLVSPVTDIRAQLKRNYSPDLVRAWRREGIVYRFSSQQDRMLGLRYSYYRDASRLETVAMADEIHQPTLVVHGGRDPLVPARDSVRFVRRLAGPSRLIILSGEGHAMSGLRRPQRVLDESVVWFGQYLKPRMARVVDVFIRHRGKVLILRRSSRVGHYRRVWAPVTGYLQPRQSAVAQAYLEVHEELGLRRSQLTLVRVGRPVRVTDQAIDRTWIVTPIVFDSTTSRVRRDWEHTAQRWVRPDRFPLAQSLPGMSEVMKRVGLR